MVFVLPETTGHLILNFLKSKKTFETWKHEKIPDKQMNSSPNAKGQK